MLKELIPQDWADVLSDTLSEPYFEELDQFLTLAYKETTVYPQPTSIFEAFTLTPYKTVKVVIIGQDPYHGEDQAHGLSFSVLPGIKCPPSLKNIFKELKGDCDIDREEGYLVDWAEQGVLMINDVLTVKAKEPRSHRKKGWEHFTHAVISALNEKPEPIIFVLWGNDAIKKEKIIASHHTIIKGPHPSPLSAYRGFFGSKPFSTINQYLNDYYNTTIKW